MGSGKVRRRCMIGYAPAGRRSHINPMTIGRQSIVAVISSRVSMPACTTLLDSELPEKMH